MITLDGKQHIKRYLSGQSNNLAKSISFGVGSTGEAVTDKRLAFEIARADITVSSYDYIADKIIMKATIPEEVTGSIHEIAVWTLSANAAAGGYSSRIITSFDSATELWTGGGFTSNNTRIGADSLTLSPAAGTSETAILSESFIDLSGYSNADEFTVAYYYGGTNLSSVNIRLVNDASNYFEVTFVPVAGYNIAIINKGSASVVGVPDWEAVASIEVSATATAGGTGTIELDGLRIEDVNSLNEDYVMISRDVVTPVVKEQSKTMDIEFGLGVVA